jgi:uncharacterized protein (TIGR02996 family)
MNDEAAFLAAIAAAPDDRTLPLVFADWLEERDDPRGRWIRDRDVRPWMGAAFADPIPLIVESLTKEKKVVVARRAAVAIGEPIVPALLELLKHTDARVRGQACVCLRGIGPRAKAAVPALTDLFNDPDIWVREKAARAVGDIGADATVEAAKLTAALTNADWTVRAVASKALGRIGAKASALEELAERFESPLEADRIEVIEGLKQLGTADAVTHLDVAADDPSPAVREAAVRALGILRHAIATPVLRDKLADPDSGVRMAAVDQFAVYWRKGTFTPDEVAALLPLLSDSDARLRAHTCQTMLNAGKVGAPATPRLVELLDDDDAFVRATAALALGEVAIGSSEPIRSLLKLLVDEPHVARAAVIALGQWPALPDSATPQLMEYHRRARATGDWGTIRGAFGALSCLRPPSQEVLDALRAAVRGGDEQYAAIEALTRLGPAAEPAIGDLLALLRQDNTPGGVVNALASIGGLAIDRVAELLDGPDEALRTRVLQRLWDVREAGVPLLPALMRAYRRTTNDYCRSNVLRAIGHFGPAAGSVIPDLLDVLEQPDRADGAGEVLNALAFMGEGLVPHVPRLAELSLRPHLWKVRGSFAFRLANTAEHTSDALGPLRALLRVSYALPDEAERWPRRDARNGVLQGLSALAARGWISDPAGTAADLRPLVDDPETPVREALPPLLGKLGIPGAPLLCRLLTDADAGIRAKAVDALAEAGDTSAETLAALIHAVEDREARVRRGAVDALNKLKAGTPEVLAALEVAAADTDAKVAERAAVALKKLTPKPAKTAAPRTKGKKKPT